MEQKKPHIIIRILGHMFPKSAKSRFIMGAWWIIETIFIETPLYFYITTPYQQQIIGPINLTYYISSMFAAAYAAACLGLGYWKWSRERPWKKPL